ncbi:UNVERIFIED_CONTAM: hypothetical protein HDU68_011360 [Siphonaria sp. JEL0065]|nr:hypothetical protein HDU68_011360 [Siphonaria sp. JEL0065]
MLLLGHNHLSHAIPDEIGNLRSLFTLNLESNQLTGLLPQSIGTLPLLSELEVNDNQLSGTIPESIYRITSLLTLNLSQNQLSGSISQSIGNLTHLDRLILSHNHFDGHIPTTIRQLVDLDHLDLSHNHLIGSVPQEISELTELIEVYLNDNDLTGNLPKALGNLFRLRKFCVTNTNICPVVPADVVPPVGYKFQLGAWLSGEAGTPAFSPAAFNKKLGYNLASYQAAQSIPPRLSADKTIAYADPDPALFGTWFSNVSNWDDGTDASVFMTIYADTILADGRQGLDVITDEMIISLAHRLNAIIVETGRKVYMRWLPEMNGDWMLYGKLPAQYVAMWNRMGAIMRANAPRVILVWSPNFDLRAGDTSYWFVEALLHKCKLSIHARPGPQYVDMVGTSVYFKGFGVNYAIQHGYASGSFDPVYSEYAQQYNLPFIVSECSAAWETGPGHSPVTGAEFASVSNEVTQATFQKQFWEGILSPDVFAAFPLLHSAYIFEIAKQEEFFSDFRVTEDPAVLAAFKSVIKAVDDAGYMLWANKTGPHTSSAASSTGTETKILTTAVATGAKQSSASGIYSSFFIFSFALWFI